MGRSIEFGCDSCLDGVALVRLGRSWRFGRVGALGRRRFGAFGRRRGWFNDEDRLFVRSLTRGAEITADDRGCS
ncbi:MAG TPA: hypothetical protein VGQ02_09125, partial [Candidatus Limnocylindrales bacterium]|nr:hypothetical protein [Candidatus Limnocylindrales bacterium]